VLSVRPEGRVDILFTLSLCSKVCLVRSTACRDRRGLSPLSGRPKPTDQRSRRITLLSFQRPRRLPRPRKKASGHTRGPSVPFLYGRIGLGSDGLQCRLKTFLRSLFEAAREW